MFRNITFVCGHTADIELFSTEKQICSYAAWAKHNEICPQCRMDQWKKHLNPAPEEDEKKGYPPLRGSEKQTAWAYKLRKRFLKKLYACKELTVEQKDEIADIELDIHDSAKWFIDNKDRYDSVLAELIKARTA